MTRRRKDAWSLTPGDFPSERAIAREPRLGNMENNAVFRMIKFRQKRRGISIVGSPGCLVAAVFISCLLSGPVSIFFILVVLGAMWLANQGRVMQFNLLGLNKQDFADFIESGISDTDILSALWASSISRRYETIRFCSAAAGFLTGLGLMIPKHPAYWIGGLAFVFFTVAVLIGLGATPYFVLGGITRSVRAAKARLEWRPRPFYSMARLSGRSLRAIVVWFALMCPAGCLISFAFETIRNGAEGEYMGAKIAGLFLSLICGALMGMLFSDNTTWGGTPAVDAIAQDLSQIREMIRAEVFEPGEHK